MASFQEGFQQSLPVSVEKQWQHSEGGLQDDGHTEVFTVFVRILRLSKSFICDVLFHKLTHHSSSEKLILNMADAEG